MFFGPREEDYANPVAYQNARKWYNLVISLTCPAILFVAYKLGENFEDPFFGLVGLGVPVGIFGFFDHHREARRLAKLEKISTAQTAEVR